MSGGEPRGHGLSGGGGPFSTGYSLRPLSPVDPVSVTLMTTQTTTHLYDVTISVLD